VDSHESADGTPRVVVVDDHDVFRQGLVKLLGEHQLDVVGEAADGEQALKAVSRLAPDVVVMDLSLPRLSGLETIGRLGLVAPSARVLVLTISADEVDVTKAILAGACGYLLKDASIEQIVDGIRAAAAGESLISSKVATTLLERVRSTGVETSERVELSDREVEVMRLVAEGMDNTAIGQALFISPQTVKNHISNILTKLQMDNRIQAAVYAVRRGLV
jgi:DNA-binding NarL/FixJ family response regulator